MDVTLLQSLNVPQLKAVQHPPQTPLQILAGPGSGKTKVLTSRIAYLILHHKIPASSICAVTFTNKAANEMRERLEKLLGKERTNQVQMGTFHALCAGFLRRWCGRVGLGIEPNFTVCDAEESKKIVAKLLVPHKDYLEARNISLKEGTVLSMISKAKAKGQTPDDVAPAPSTSQPRPTLQSGATEAKDIQYVVSEVYREYERTLRRNNSLDFDDLLVFGLKLFSGHPTSVAWCKHVLVDEFQDTNITQYELMRHIAAAHGCVTVVGDPDQSIYGWRSAEIENLSKMCKDFPLTDQIFLEQNYRSTGSILAASLAIVAEDKTRIPKTLHTAHPAGPTPVLRTFQEESQEASFIAMEVKRLVAASGGMLGWGDFVVLLRFNALSRSIESALQKEGILSRVLGGHKFFDRAEIKDLLAYLQIVDNPYFVPAFSRAINIPARGIGDKTLGEILTRATQLDASPLSVVERVYDGKLPDVKPPVRKKLKGFVESVRTLRKLAEEGTSPADLVRRLLDLVNYEDYLKHKDQEWATRWENVQELINFASEPPSELGSGAVEGATESEENAETPLRSFLQASMLSSAGDNDDSTKEKVTISTCHAAKGLEWPVVMVPAVEQGTFPFYRSEDVEEERRLLYVACTRAQGLLYLSYTVKRRVGGETKGKNLSEFISSIVTHNQNLFATSLPELTQDERTLLGRVLDRRTVAEAEVQRRLAEFNRTNRCHSLVVYDPDGPVPAVAPISRTWNGMAEFYKPTIPMLSTAVSQAPPIVRPTALAPTRTINIFANSNSNSTPAKKDHLSVARSIKPPIYETVEMQPLGLGQTDRTFSSASSIPTTQPYPLSSPGQKTASSTSPPSTLSSSGGVVAGNTLKRRLGMGRLGGGSGYPNKKFKSQAPGP